MSAFVVSLTDVLHGGGITISGTRVRSNERRSPDEGRGAKPEAPHFGEATGPEAEKHVGDMPAPLGDDEIGCDH